MKTDFLTLLQDSNYKKCWYPCSGDDFEATSLWTTAFTNTIKSNLFILTDSELHRINERNNKIDRLKSQGYELLGQITIDNMNVPMGQIDWRFNEIDWYNVSENEFIEIIQDGAFDTFIENQDKAELIELIKMGMVSISTYASNLAEINTELKTRILKIIKKNQKSVSATLYKKDGNLMIFILCDNVDFYDYCNKHEIIIDGAIVIRHQLDMYLHSELLSVFRRLKTYKLIVYLNQCNEVQRDFFMQHQIGEPINYKSYSSLFPDRLILAEWSVEK